jgi:hypothetical protein
MDVNKLFRKIVWLTAAFLSLSILAELPSRLPPPTVTVSFPPLDLSVVPASLEPLFCDASYIERCRLVQGLKDNLSQAEVDALLLFIAADPRQLGLSRGHFNSVGDEVICALEDQRSIPPELTDRLIAMFNDESGEITWRDYCIQHLGSLYATEAAVGKRELIMKTFDVALQPGSRMAGTVVIALKRNIGREGIAQAMVSQKAAALAMDEELDESSRLTSMLVAAELGNPAMLPLARELIVSRKPVQLRMSAMATVGMLGDASDLSILGKYTSSPDMRLRGASKAAIKKIAYRQNDLVAK